jgi:hypothetical protein
MGRRKYNEIEKAQSKIYKGIDELYAAVCDRVKAIQEANGKDYVDTQDKNKDNIYFLAYDSEAGNDMHEGTVCGVRVVRNGSCLDLQFVGSIVDVRFDAESFEDCNRNYGDSNEIVDYNGFDGEWEESWQYVKNHDLILYVPTLLSIAESIDQYI